MQAQPRSQIHVSPEVKTSLDFTVTKTSIFPVKFSSYSAFFTNCWDADAINLSRLYPTFNIQIFLVIMGKYWRYKILMRR